MRRVRLAGCVLAALGLLAAASVASAAETPYVLPEPTKVEPILFLIASESVSLTRGAIKISCETSAGLGELNGPREGDIEMTLQKCSALGISCNTEGAGEGDIEIAPELHFVTYTELKLLGVLTLPGEREVKCGKTMVKIRGNVLGTVEGVASGVETEEAQIRFKTESSKQTPKECSLPAGFCVSRKFLLEADLGAGWEELTLVAKEKLVFAKKIEVIY